MRLWEPTTGGEGDERQWWGGEALCRAKFGDVCVGKCGSFMQPKDIPCRSGQRSLGDKGVVLLKRGARAERSQVDCSNAMKSRGD